MNGSGMGGPTEIGTGMFKRVLVANRGEIARRIMRTARRMGLETVAVFSDADRDMPFVREADRAVRIGPAPARESYLLGERIIAAARETGAEAVHPGYGFLSENAGFAEAVEAAGLLWVGAPPAAIRAMGLKDAAKALMRNAGVAVTPGYDGAEQSPARLREEAERIGFPVLIKAVAGGGGKGMRAVGEAAGFAEALQACRREAAGSFGDDRVLVEKLIASPRHVEVQVFGDRHGNVVHLFERDCSLQRRHQKVVEEAPAPGMGEAAREAVCAAAVRAARAVDYVGAGTVEFIAEGGAEGGAELRPDRIWFMEMNTRLQVEHPVTEMITGQDLVEWQFRVAAGETLPLQQDAIRMNGWAMEARLYAENPRTGFLPSTGRLDRLRLPRGMPPASVRVEAGVEEGGEVSGFYDPMIAKLVVHAPDRRDALAKLADACASVQAWPVRTNAGFLARVLREPAFARGAVDTGFVEQHAARLAGNAEPPELVQQAAARAVVAGAVVAGAGDDPWDALVGFRVNAGAVRTVAVAIDGREVAVELATAGAGEPEAVTVGHGRVLFHDGEGWGFEAPRVADAAAAGGGGTATADGTVRTPMPGQVTVVAVAEGERVEAGQLLLAVEAMKMETRLSAPCAGMVEALSVRRGDQVAEGAVLLRVRREEAAS